MNESLTKPCVGYPTRPTGGGELPRDFSMVTSEVATPKLDGHRVLVNPTTSEFFNRHREPYTHMSADDKQNVLKALRVVEAPIAWWDIEYMPHGRNKGKFMILDCVHTFDSKILYYHGRRALWVNHFPEASVDSPLTLCTRFEYELYNSKWEWYTDHQGRPIEPTMAFCAPIFVTTQGAQSLYANMRRRAKEVDEVLEEKSIWEGIVVKFMSTPYTLTNKQSQNMHMEVKYRYQ